jgi:hypothetical protein
MKQVGTLAITGGRLVTPAGIIEGTMRCIEGRIVEIGPDVVAQGGGWLRRAWSISGSSRSISPRFTSAASPAPR